MEPDVICNSDSEIEVFDETGRMIGTITRPVDGVVLGPGRQKVYLARRAPRADQHSQAA
jgi:hypothetical protein